MIEQIKEGSCGRLNSGRQAVPPIRRQRTAGTADVKPFLEIHGEGVGWCASGRLPRSDASGNHAEFLRRSAMMNEAIVSTECSTLVPVCSSEIETPNPR